MDIGIVEVRVAARAYRSFEVERQLVRKYDLDSAIVVASQADNADTLNLLGKAASTALGEQLKDGTTIGVSNGETVAAVAENMRRSRATNINVVTLIGGVGRPEEPGQTGQICRTLAAKVDGSAWILPVPAVVESGAVAKAFRSTQAHNEVFALVEKTNVALLGIGAMGPESSTFRHGHFSVDLMEEVLRNNAVGTICARFFDKNGEVTPTDIDSRTISISLDQLTKVPVKFGVAIGAEKVPAIKAAMRGGLINVLGTDTAAAEQLLRG